jgi:hypothetical protein
VQLGSFQHYWLGGGLDGQFGVAVAVAGALALTADIALAAQELGHLGFQGSLDDQPGDLFQDLAQVLLGGEQRIDLGADALDSG